MSPREDPQFGYGRDRPPRQEDIYVDPTAERRVRGRRRSLLPVAVAGSAVILFTGFVWIAYTHHPHARPGETPVIAAETGPVKVKPDDPGGMDIPFQDTTVYDELGGGKTHNTGTVEHLLQPPEQPMAKPEPAPQPDTKVADTAVAAAVPPAPDVTLPPPPQTPPADLQPPAPDPADTALAPPPPSTDATTPPPPADTSLLPPPPPPMKPPYQAPAVAPAQPKPVPAPTGAFAIQLGAFRDEPTANAEWERMKAAYPDELGNLKPIVERADLGPKGIWFRLKAGPITEDAAKQTCATLKADHVICFAAPR